MSTRERTVNVSLGAIVLAALSFIAGAASFTAPLQVEERPVTVQWIEPRLVEIKPDPEKDRQIECLAKNIYFEARGESLMGQAAVGIVTINRVTSAKYPTDACEVVTQAKKDRNGQVIRNKCQFSWYCDGKKDVIRNEEAWTAAVNVAKVLYTFYYENPLLPDFLQGATHYHNTSVNPRWGFDQVATIDNHVFYREPAL